VKLFLLRSFLEVDITLSLYRMHRNALCL
jgi:hypothetical protein